MLERTIAFRAAHERHPVTAEELHDLVQTIHQEEAERQPDTVVTRQPEFQSLGAAANNEGNEPPQPTETATVPEQPTLPESSQKPSRVSLLRDPRGREQRYEWSQMSPRELKIMRQRFTASHENAKGQKWKQQLETAMSEIDAELAERPAEPKRESHPKQPKNKTSRPVTPISDTEPQPIIISEGYKNLNVATLEEMHRGELWNANAATSEAALQASERALQEIAAAIEAVKARQPKSPAEPTAEPEAVALVPLVTELASEPTPEPPPQAVMTEAEQDRREWIAKKIENYKGLRTESVAAMKDVLQKDLAHLEAKGLGDDLQGRDARESIAATEAVLAERARPDHESTPAEVTAASTAPVETTPDHRPETLAAPEQESEPDGLKDVRDAYALALRRRSKFFGATKDSVLEEKAQAYHDLLETKTRETLTGIKEKFAGKNLEDPTVQSALNGDLAQMVLTFRQQEQNQLRNALRDPKEKSFFAKLQETMKKHAGQRMVASAGLLGVGLLGVGTGQLWLTAGALTARTALSAVSGAALTEASMQKGREELGGTAAVSAEKIAKMSQAELERRIAAFTMHQVDYADTEFGRRDRKFMFWKSTDETGKAILAQYETIQTANRQKRLEQFVSEHPTATVDDMVEDMILDTLGEERRLHQAYDQRRTSDKNYARMKAVVAVAVGAVAGEMAHLSAVNMQQGKGLLGGLAKGLGRKVAEHSSIDDLAGHAEHGGSSIDSLSDRTGGSSIDTLGDRATDHIPSAIGTVEIAHKGDSVWTLTAEQLSKRADLSKLSKEQSVWMIDKIKDMIVAQPQEFGLTDPDKLAVNQHLDFAKIFSGRAAVSVQALVEQAKHLTPEQLANIHVNDELLKDWHQLHPAEVLTTPKVEDILPGGDHVPAADVHHVTTPATNEYYRMNHLDVGDGVDPAAHAAKAAVEPRSWADMRRQDDALLQSQSPKVVPPAVDHVPKVHKTVPRAFSHGPVAEKVIPTPRTPDTTTPSYVGHEQTMQMDTNGVLIESANTAEAVREAAHAADASVYHLSEVDHEVWEKFRTAQGDWMIHVHDPHAMDPLKSMTLEQASRDLSVAAVLEHSDNPKTDADFAKNLVKFAKLMRAAGVSKLAKLGAVIDSVKVANPDR